MSSDDFLNQLEAMDTPVDETSSKMLNRQSTANLKVNIAVTSPKELERQTPQPTATTDHTESSGGLLSRVETAMRDKMEKIPDCTLAINCEEHNRPAVFYSKQKNTWRCFMCMMNQEGLVYVDKQYKHDMEYYESIKATTFRSVVENTPSKTLIASWKNQIRDTLFAVRTEFIDWIDSFTHKFVRSLNKIEQSKEMSDYTDQDRLLSIEVNLLESKYKRILEIFQKISLADPDKKLDTV